MSEELIDRYVKRDSISDDTSFLTGQLKQVLELFDKVNATKITLSGAKGMSEVVNSAKQAQTALAGLEAATDKLTKSDIQQAKAAREMAAAKLQEARAALAAAKTTTEEAKAKVQEANAIKQLYAAEKLEAQARKEIAAQAKLEAQARKENAAAALKEQQLLNGDARKKERDAINEIGRAYIEYSKAAREASLRAKSYALTLGETHPTTLAAVKNAKEMNDILLRVDQSVGQSQRNVGNYKSAFDGLSFSFTQVARELPSLAVSAQTFALAISNNFPMVIDEIKKARVEIAALKAEGQAAPTLFQRIGASLISWNVGLSIGIALVTAYAGKIVEWVKDLFDSEAATRKAAKAQQAYNKQIEEAIELNEKYYKDIKRFGEDSVNRKLENDLLRARALGKSEKEILEIERAIALERATNASQAFFSTKGEKELSDLEEKLNEAKFAYREFLQARREGELTENEKKQGEFLKDNFDLAEKAYLRQKKVVEDYYNANRDLEIKDLELKKLAAEQRAKFFADELQYRADILKNISQLEDAERITRLNARKQALKNEKAIIEGEYQDELFAAKDNLVKILEATREYNFRKKKLAEEYERDVLAIRQTALAKRREIEQQDNEMFYDDQEERLNKQIENIQKEQERRLMESSKGQAAEIANLNKWYESRVAATKEGSKKRQKIEEEYARKRAEIEYQYAVAAIKNEIWAAEQILKVRKAAGIDVTSQEEELSRLKIQLSDLETKHFIDNEKRKGKTFRERMEDTERALQRALQIQQAVSNLIGGLITANVDREKNIIQDQIDDIDRKKEKEIDAINTSARTEQEKAAAIAILNSKAAAQKEQLERKQRQLDLQRARFEKAANLTRIAVETALAVVHQLATGDPYTAIGRAIAAGAFGAAQFAVAAAQPLPKFKHGREDGPATFGIVGDGGKQEVIYSPDLKHAMVTPDTDTLAYIPKGYGVAPSVEDFQAMAMRMAHKELPVMPVIQQNNNDDLIYAMAHEIGSLKRAIMGKQETHFHWHDGELKKAIKKGNDWYRYIQNNI